MGEEQLHAAAKFRNMENLLRQSRRSEPRDNKTVIENENRDGSSEKKGRKLLPDFFLPARKWRRFN